MTHYLLLFTGGGMPETEAEQAAALQAWGVWYTGMGEAVVDPGKPFTPFAKSIASDGTVSDGPVGGMASGYTIVQAGSLREAVSHALSCPLLQAGGQISVFETFEMA